MALLEWKEEYKIGFPAVDYEHENLINAIGNVQQRLAGDGAADEIRGLLAEINTLVEAHFALEEKVMRDIGYEGFIPHKADHDLLLEQIRDIMESVEDEPGPAFRDDLGRRLNDWFARHFASEDKKLHASTGGKPH